MNTFLVTGASGFVGRHFTKRLIEQGHHVRCLMRSASSTGAVVGAEMIRYDDIGDRAVLRHALAGVDTIVHLAAHVHVVPRSPGEAEAFGRVNVQGTQVLVDAAADAGVPDVLFLSSVAAVGVSGDCHIDAGTPPAPRTAYGLSKLEAEQVVARAARARGMRAVILRPPAIYGPSMKGNLTRLFQLVRARVPIPVPLRVKRRSLIYIGNLVDAGLHALRAGPRGTSTYLVADGETASTRDLLRMIARLLGVRPILIPLPSPVMRAAGRVGDTIGARLPVPLDSARIDALFSSLTLDTSAIVSQCGYRPRYTLEEGMRETAAWFQSMRSGRAEPL